MSLGDLWFILISILFIGFFFLEGFDYGVGILMPFLGKTDQERRQVINTIGPFWDGNEVWMITAGGAIFAAFPNWYATLFSGFYLALVLILLALIVRGVAFEFRSKHDALWWRSLWDWSIFIGSLLPAILWGVAFGNIIQGVPIDGDMIYTGNFFDLLSPYTVLCGVASLAVFTLHGAVFITLRADGVVRERAEALLERLWIVAVAVSVLLTVANYVSIDIFDKVGVNPGVMPIASAAALLTTGYFIRQKSFGWTFIMLALAIVLSVVTYFWFLYPNVLVSSTGDVYNLTVENTAASDLTLKIMTVVALIFVPLVLLYQGWSYWAFRQRVTLDSHLEY